jgi:soluble lytic murein transglycosylase-like protein
VPRQPSSRFCVVLAGCAALAAAPCAHALEHITLRNGFSVDCAHHEVIGERVRLYKSKNDTNYQELPAADIATVEALPDPPEISDEARKTAAKADSPTHAEMQDLFAHSGAEHNIDVELLASIAKAESNFHANAVSRAGARGVMQLMPSTAHDLGVTDISRADQNIAGGAAYLDSLLTRYKDNLVLALAAYNAGPAAVARYHGIPPFRETRTYVARVISEFNRRKTAALRAAKLEVAAR